MEGDAAGFLELHISHLEPLEFINVHTVQVHDEDDEDLDEFEEEERGGGGDEKFNTSEA